MLIRSKTVFSLAIAILFGCQCVHLNAQETEGQADGAKKLNTIATELGSEEEFATLNTAIQAAGLDKALEGEGPFTVFAPTEEAFKKVGAETLEELLKESTSEPVNSRRHKLLRSLHVLTCNRSSFHAKSTHNEQP